MHLLTAIVTPLLKKERVRRGRQGHRGNRRPEEDQHGGGGKWISHHRHPRGEDSQGLESRQHRAAKGDRDV